MLYFCPFRAFIAIVIIIIPRCRFAYRWAIYALHLPFQGARVGYTFQPECRLTSFVLPRVMDDLHLTFDILSTSSLHGITKASLVLLLLRSSVQGVYCYCIIRISMPIHSIYMRIIHDNLMLE